jgi:hypothetical protein
MSPAPSSIATLRGSFAECVSRTPIVSTSTPILSSKWRLSQVTPVAKSTTALLTGRGRQMNDTARPPHEKATVEYLHVREKLAAAEQANSPRHQSAAPSAAEVTYLV